jgi:hypothetical protein
LKTWHFSRKHFFSAYFCFYIVSLLSCFFSCIIAADEVKKGHYGRKLELKQNGARDGLRKKNSQIDFIIISILTISANGDHFKKNLKQKNKHVLTLVRKFYYFTHEA